ncbi:unnamed protein product [Clonostachys byssicola]|uniref:Uncharacterized protein n=1 Tax=Clonostachys byssicola TaxID=160290 RepID=A0A9N9U2X6_9HYPO|nr:unnamed protein product [Clonostachys byssicola]
METYSRPILSKIHGDQAAHGVYAGTSCLQLDRLHVKYGPIVRIGPDEVSVSDWRHLRTRYQAKSGVIKDARFYDPIRIDPAEHAARRKLSSSPDSLQSIAQLDPIIQKQSQILVTRLLAQASASASGTADAYMLCGLYSLEVICQAGFAKEFTGPTATDDARHLLDLIDGSAAAFMYSASIPFASMLGPRLPGPIGASYRAFADWQQASREMVDHFLQHSSEETKYLLNPLSQSSDRFLNRKLAHNELVEEAKTYMFAGSGTTSTTLTYILYEISKPNHRHIQDRLYQEVRGLQEGDITGLRNNNYVNAVIKETMRLHPTIISTLPRLLTEPMQLDNLCLPSGTIVGMQNWIHHRNPAVYPSPESFVPDRWLDATVEMESSLTPFGVGRRNCIGQNLAWQELYWAIDSLMRAGVQLELGSQMGNWEMEKIDRFNIAPRGKRLMLAVTKSGKI